MFGEIHHMNIPLTEYIILNRLGYMCVFIVKV